MNILNLYSGIGGNRKLWPKDNTITSIENNPKVAKEYKKLFPEDKIIVTDAHDYLLKHYKDYDFIWSSPPCQTHSKTNYFLNSQGIIRYPNMKLYEEILFLKSFCKVKWVVENVKSFYEPLIKPFEIGRHYFWSNFYISKIKTNKSDIGTMNRNVILFKQQTARKKNQNERNAVNSELGLHIFNCAFKIKQTILK